MEARPAWLIYGANGYTGRLIAAEAVRRGERPVLAGRREVAVRAVAEPLGLEVRTFGLDDPAAVDRGLEGMAAAILAAGPFSGTSRPFVDACLRTATHYLDITGEIPVFEAVFARDAEAAARGVALLPGVGFDVVPTDCLAAALSTALPGAQRLALAFAPVGGGPSPGTARTMLEGLGRGGAVREGGRIRREPVAARERDVPFRDRTRRAYSIPWGDVATAWRSTGIGDVVVYSALPRRAARALRLARPLAGVLAWGPARGLARRAVGRFVKGPDPAARRTGRSEVWGRVEDARGRALEARATTPGGYPFTAYSAVECVRRLLGMDDPPRGARTPSAAFGAGLLADLPGCEVDPPHGNTEASAPVPPAEEPAEP